MSASNRRIIIVGVVLVAAILAFMSLGFAPVTVLQTTTQTEWSSYPYTQTLTQNCCFTIYVTLPQPTSILAPFATNYSLAPTQYVVTSPLSSLITYTTTQTFSNVPASEAIGLSPSIFILLAVTVIGVLAVLVAWLVVKSRKKPSDRS